MIDEFVDALDDQGIPTGITVSKSEAHRRGILHRAAHVLVYTQDHQILLQQRAQKKTGNPGLWDISVAGHVAAGEAPLSAAIRELEEELGIVTTPADLRFLCTGLGSYGDEKSIWRCNVRIESYALLSPDATPVTRIQASEVSTTKWVKFDALKSELLNPAVVSRYVAHGQYWLDALDAMKSILNAPSRYPLGSA